MKPLVRLDLRVRLPDGTYPYLKAAFASNGRIRPTRQSKIKRLARFPLRPVTFATASTLCVNPARILLCDSIYLPYEYRGVLFLRIVAYQSDTALPKRRSDHLDAARASLDYIDL